MHFVINFHFEMINIKSEVRLLGVERPYRSPRTVRMNTVLVTSVCAPLYPHFLLNSVCTRKHSPNNIILNSKANVWKKRAYFKSWAPYKQIDCFIKWLEKRYSHEYSSVFVNEYRKVGTVCTSQLLNRNVTNILRPSLYVYM